MKACSMCNVVKSYENFSPNRRVKDGLQARCKRCTADLRAQWRKGNPERVKAENAAYREANPNWWKDHYAANRDKEAARKAKAYAEDKAIFVARQKAYVVANPHRGRARLAKRRAALLRATPAWADMEKVREFYFAADFLGMVTGDWYEVDHVVPLQGKNVCGLHCEQNLQVLLRTENRHKGRKWHSV